MFGALLRFSIIESVLKAGTSRSTLFLAGASGLITTTLGIALVFFPAQQITSVWSYEFMDVRRTLFFIGLAAFFFLFCLRPPQDAAAKVWEGRDFSRAPKR